MQDQAQEPLPLQHNRKRERLLGFLVFGACVVVIFGGLWLLGVWVDGDF
jgi:hypothetical protein